MSLKRPLSLESDSNLVQDDTHQFKRLKLHSIIQELRNEEAKLILLKKLRTSQQLATRTTKISPTVKNGFHPTATRITTPTHLPTKPITNLSSQPPIVAARKTSNSPLLTNANKILSSHSYEERKNQAKLVLRKQLERDLLSIPPPKPSLQDVLFIPNGISLEFPPLLGLEDVIQCLNELHNDRHRLPQRFTDHASIENPHICDQCGTDFTIRWWKHSNPKSSTNVINILCDRCKKQVVRRTSKSEHSTLLKNVFISAMKQEKEIEKNFHSLIKQEKASSRSKSSTTTTTTTLPSMPISHLSSANRSYQTKPSLPSNLSTKFSQQITRKTNGNVPITNNHSRTGQSNKMPMPIHHPQQQYRSSQPNKKNSMMKTVMKQQTVLPSSRSIFPSNPDLLNALLSSNFGRPTSTKRRTVPTIELK